MDIFCLNLEKKPVATARRRKTEKGIKLERFSVLKDYRNKGIGTELLKFVLKDVIPLSKYIYIHSQINALNFYLRNGFKVIGKMFIEADIEHYFMRYEG
jgi:predicted GNAT family N-acyltransferase